MSQPSTCQEEEEEEEEEEEKRRRRRRKRRRKRLTGNDLKRHMRSDSDKQRFEVTHAQRQRQAKI